MSLSFFLMHLVKTVKNHFNINQNRIPELQTILVYYAIFYILCTA
jgi:hypothetical protein